MTSRAGAVERRVLAEVELDVGEVDGVAREEGAQAREEIRHEIVTRLRARLR